MKKIIILLLSVFIITGCFNKSLSVYDNYNKSSNFDESTKKVKTHKNISYDEYLKKIDNKESFIILLWQTGCSHCEAFEPKLNDVITHYNLNVYGLNLADLNEEQYQKVKNKTFISGTPTLVYIEKGVFEDKLVGDKEIEDILEFLKDINYLKENSHE